MIKVNLLNNRSVTSGGDTTYAISVDKGGGVKLQKESIVKILLASVFTVALVIVENNNIDNLEKEHQLYVTELNEIQAKIAKLKEEAAKLAEFERQSHELEDKMKIMKTLSKTRLTELKALDVFQTLMPERVWLDSLVYRDDQFRLKGKALTDDDLTDLIQAMDKSPFFSDILLLQAKETSGQQGTLKSFEITTSIVGQE
ncbi:MAG: PilN domain-containing protein [Bdellovibrionales bacterium]|nr:PilN domain-containing protein [Bdellovibrionales bacterium]